jgi:hypothetical protein
MSDTTIIVISILAFFLILFGVTAWLVFAYFPRKTLAMAKELAETVKNTLGMTPQVTVNQRVIYKRTNEILQLAMIEQDFDVEHETSHMWMRSEKRVSLRGTYRAKIGFDLQKGFNIEVRRNRLLKPGEIVLQLPHAEVLSVEPLEVQKMKSSGLINWVTNKDIEAAMKDLTALAQDKASKLEMLEDAEKRIENRLNEALLPRLGGYNFTHRVKFLEATPGLPRPTKEESGGKMPELTLG